MSWIFLSNLVIISQKGGYALNYKDFTVEIKKMSNIDLSSYKEKQMKRRIDSLIKRSGYKDYDSYVRFLKHSKQHLKEFLGYITINVSEFFRNPAQWEILEREIIPKLISNKERLKIWSSAASRGEEPYSVAMLLDKMGIINRAEIIATDIDENALKKAKKGGYLEKEVANIPKAMLRANFREVNDKYIIKDKIKNTVNFRLLDLLTDTFPYACDLILCRNVMIYFTENTKDKLYKKFHNALSDKGIFFVGNTEQIIMPQKYGFINYKNFFYQKTHLRNT